MKATILVFAALALFVQGDLSEEQKAKILAHGKACIADTGVSRDVVLAARQGTFADDPKLQAFTYCMSKRLGFQTESGEVVKDVLVQKLGGAIGNAQAAEALADKCLVSKATPELTAFDSFKCYYDSTPNHLTVF